ncbi:MAG: hypothetical protein AVDCRST_MAG56-255, partial [uncultured Cytophagales bacterium]
GPTTTEELANGGHCGCEKRRESRGGYPALPRHGAGKM